MSFSIKKSDDVVVVDVEGQLLVAVLCLRLELVDVLTGERHERRVRVG